MPLATKNDRLIVKQSRLAENCLCCEESCCPGDGGAFPVGTATLSVTRKLNVVAFSSCACRPFFSPPTSATLCFDETGTFSQTDSDACIRTLSGVGYSQAYWLQYPVEEGPFTATVGFISNPCRIYASLNWQFFRCAANLDGNFWAWDYVQSQTTYSAAYYVYVFTNFAGFNYPVLNTTGVVPTDQSPYFWGGSTWTVTMELSFA